MVLAALFSRAQRHRIMLTSSVFEGVPGVMFRSGLSFAAVVVFALTFTLHAPAVVHNISPILPSLPHDSVLPFRPRRVVAAVR